MPPQVESLKEVSLNNNNLWDDAPLKYYHFFTDEKQSKGDFLNSRNEFLKNEHCVVSTAHVSEDTNVFFRNSSL